MPKHIVSKNNIAANGQRFDRDDSVDERYRMTRSKEALADRTAILIVFMLAAVLAGWLLRISLRVSRIRLASVTVMATSMTASTFCGRLAGFN